MSVATVSDYLEAIAHLPEGTALRADDVSWEEYEQLLEDLGPSYSVRIFYDQGRMEISSPVSAHEKPTKVISRLVNVLSDELDIDIESLGSTTLKRQIEEAGAEPDDSFYIQNASAIIGKLDVTLEHDPPPDIVVESDHTSSSLDKFAIYAALGVPEIWRITKRQVRIWLLEGNVYNESPVSRAFPFLPAQTLNEFLARGLAEGERKAARAFREWVRGNRQKPS
ncbi:MAG TPA: Uma2 family endonuclease [Blastocatellia bacterium]|nr:Uma2 family endonuclease [Blastocatellia bacterium]